MIRIILAILFFAVGIILSYFQEMDQLPWNLGVAVMGVFFYEIAAEFKEDLLRYLKKIPLLLLILLVSVSIVSTFLNDEVEMLHLCYGNPFLFAIGSLSGICITLCFSLAIEKNKLCQKCFCFLGQNTILIMAFHIYPVYWIIDEFNSQVLQLPYNNNIFSGSFEALIYSVIAIVVLLPVIIIVNRYFPWVVGKTNMKKHLSKIEF